MANEIQQGEQFIESDEPADDRYGQNGYTGASSLLPGQSTPQSKFAPPKPTHALSSQTRSVDATSEAPTFGHRDRNPESSGAKVPSALIRK